MSAEFSITKIFLTYKDVYRIFRISKKVREKNQLSKNSIKVRL